MEMVGLDWKEFTWVDLDWIGKLWLFIIRNGLEMIRAERVWKVLDSKVFDLKGLVWKGLDFKELDFKGQLRMIGRIKERLK